MARPGLDTPTVIDRAAALADQEGLEALTLAALAAALGIRTPSLYHHVAGLPGLQRQLALRGYQQLGAQLMQAAVGLSGAAALRSMAAAYRAFIIAHPGTYAATIRCPLRDDDAELQQASGALLQLILTVLRPYQLDAAAALHAVRAFRSAIHGFATLESAGGFGQPLSADASFAHLIASIIAGLETLSTVEEPS